MFKKALIALALLVSATGASFAQTAGQAVTGFLLAQGSTYGSFTCPASFTSPCFVQYGSTLPISGSITANLSGFTPTAGATAALSATGTSADVALPAGTDVVVSSPSTNTVPVFIRLQTGAGTAVTSDLPVNPGAAVGFHITTQTHISGITGGTAASLQIQGGAGLATGYGGGGSGSGGGTSVAQGSTTAGQNVSPMGCRTLTSAPTDTTAQTNMPWCTTKGSQVVAQPTAADLNATVTGTVAATQSGTWTVQPGNTANTTAWKVDGSAVTQPVSGSVSLTGATNNINNVSGTVSLPTGAATSALQPTNAAQASTTSGQTGPLVQCSVTTAAPTYTTAQTDPINCTTGGSVRVLDNNSAALLTAAQAATPAGSNIIGKVGIDQTTDGTTNAVHLVAGTAIAGKVGIDQTTLGTTNAVQNISGTTGGVTPFTLTAANSTNATNIKASAGTLYHIGVYNNSATLAWVSFYNTAGTPSCGTSIVYQTMIPANSTSGGGAVEDFATGMNFGTGIGICVTTGIAGTGAVAASAYVVGLGYK